MALDWHDKEVIARVLRRTSRFVRWMVSRLDEGRCDALAQDAVSFVWEKCETGRLVIGNEAELRQMACDKAYSLARKEMMPSRNHLSYDNPDDARIYDKWAYARSTMADQIQKLYTAEVHRGITLLPNKQREVMELLWEGHNAADIAIRLRLPIWTCMARIRDARRMLFWNGLVEVGIVGTGVPS